MNLNTFRNLEKNSIKEIAKNAFKNLHELRELYLNDNKIENIIDGTFSDVPVLEKL